MPSVNKAFAMIEAPTNMKDKLPNSNAFLQAVVAATSKQSSPMKKQLLLLNCWVMNLQQERFTSETKK
jgi:hypothetical protein